MGNKEGTKAARLEGETPSPGGSPGSHVTGREGASVVAFLEHGDSFSRAVWTGVFSKSDALDLEN